MQRRPTYFPRLFKLCTDGFLASRTDIGGTLRRSTGSRRISSLRGHFRFQFQLCVSRSPSVRGQEVTLRSGARTRPVLLGERTCQACNMPDPSTDHDSLPCGPTFEDPMRHSGRVGPGLRLVPQRCFSTGLLGAPLSDSGCRAPRVDGSGLKDEGYPLCGTNMTGNPAGVVLLVPKMIQAGQLTSAQATALTFALHSRPSEAPPLCRIQVIPPVRAVDH